MTTATTKKKHKLNYKMVMGRRRQVVRREHWLKWIVFCLILYRWVKTTAIRYEMRSVDDPSTTSVTANTIHFNQTTTFTENQTTNNIIEVGHKVATTYRPPNKTSIAIADTIGFFQNSNKETLSLQTNETHMFWLGGQERL